MVADPDARPEVLPDRPADGERHGPARAPPRSPPDRRRAQRRHRGRGVAVGGRPHRRRGVDRQPWWAYLAAFVLMGPMYARFAILMHEAAHKLLFTNKRVNDWVGTWLHRLPDLDPDLHLPPGPLRPPQGGVRPPRAGHRLLRRLPLRPAPPCRRRLVRDAVGISGWKNFTPLFKALRSHGRPAGGRLHPRRAGRPVGRHVGGHRPLVDLPAAVVAPVDDPVAGDQPAAGHRRARRPRGQRRPPGDHPQRAPVAARPVLVRALQHRAGTWPTTWTWASRSATCPPSTPSWSGPATSPTGLTYPNYRSLWRALASA